MGEPLPIPLVASCVSKLCDALHYVHFKKDTSGKDLHIVHRGLCLQDVLISFEGELKVVDFGLARAFMRATQTQPGIIKGKRGYMSPDQVRGLPVDRRSDIFSIGICFYELLTGKRLFEADSDAVYFEKVRKAEVPPPAQYNRHIPTPLEKIILKALARDVDARYQYASELSGDLKPFCTALQPGVDRERHFSPDDGAAFGRKSLAQYMQFAFAKEVERERQRMADFATLQPPGSQGNE
jgi:serine/threonine protein kinase